MAMKKQNERKKNIKKKFISLRNRRVGENTKYPTYSIELLKSQYEIVVEEDSDTIKIIKCNEEKDNMTKTFELSKFKEDRNLLIQLCSNSKCIYELDPVELKIYIYDSKTKKIIQ